MIEPAIALIVAIVCCAAAFAVVRTRIPWALRIVVAIVLLYGASVVAVTGRGGFTAALDGAPFPTLPFWARAAYLDGQVILPAIGAIALLAGIVALVRRRPDRAGLMVLLGLAALGCAQFAAYGAGTRALPTIVAFEHAPALLQAAGAPCPDPTANPLGGIEGNAPGAGSAAQGGAQIGGMFGGGGDGAANATPKPAPVAATPACTTDANVAELFARLDEVDAKVPHDDQRLKDRAAALTSVDAAYAYVRDAVATESYPGAMRGAFGTLMARAGSSADKALLLAALLQAQHATVRFARTTLSDADVDALLRAPAAAPDPGDTVAGALDERAKATAVKVRALEEASIDDAVRDAGPLVDDLLARAATAGAKIAPDFAAAQRGALRTHDWLQAQMNGAWVDLDPALPGSAKGTHLGTRTVTSYALPEDAYATIAIRLYADRPNARGAAPVVDVTKRVAEVAGTPVTIALANRDAKLKEIAAVKEVAATATIAGTDTSSDPLSLGDLDTVRLELTLTQPGRDPRVYRRTVYHRPAGDARTVAAAATVASSMLVTAGDYDGAFIDRREIDNLRNAKPLIVWGTEHRTGAFPLPPATGPEPFPVEVLRYTVADARARARIAATLAPGSRFVYDRPTIALVRRGFRAEGTGVRGRMEFDIVENGMVPAGGDATRALRANAVRGAIDATIERRVLGDRGAGGTRGVFDAARAAGVAPVVVRAPDAGGAAVLDADARAHLTDTLALHQIAIVPQHAVALNGAQRTGWWALDPSTGDLVARMDDGAGQGEVEYVMARLNDDATLYAMIQFYGDFFRCIAMGVEAPLSGAAVNGEHGTATCMKSALCNYLEGLTFGNAIDNTLLAFIYTLLDITFYDNSPGLSWKTNSSGGGAGCAAAFKFSFT